MIILEESNKYSRSIVLQRISRVLKKKECFQVIYKANITMLKKIQNNQRQYEKQISEGYSHIMNMGTKNSK